MLGPRLAAGSNVLPPADADFEGGHGRWSPFCAEFTTDREFSHGGASSLRAGTRAHTYCGPAIFVALACGQLYRATAWARTDAASVYYAARASGTAAPGHGAHIDSRGPCCHYAHSPRRRCCHIWCSL